MRKFVTRSLRRAHAVAALEPLESRTLMTAVSGVQLNGVDLAALGAQRSVVNTVSVRFDSNVGASINGGDLRLWNATTRQFVDTSVATTRYDASTNTATWAFPFPGGRAMLPDGNYRATVQSMTVFDAAGRPLDGDGDGVGGDE